MSSFLARLARTVSRRRRLVALSWLVLVLVAAPLSARQVERLSGGGWDVPGSQSVEAMELLEQVPGRGGEPLAILVEGRSTGSVDAAVWRARSQAFEHSELRPAGPVQRFEEGRAALLPLVYVGPRGDLYDFTTDLRDQVVADAEGASTRVVGEGAMWSNFQQVAREQLATSELIGFPFIVAILLAAFGTLLATAMPIGIAVAAVTVTGAVTFLLAGPFEISIYVTNMAAMIGIGVAVDYSLFVVGRYRRGLHEGLPQPDALPTALASAGIAVVYSGATVIVSLASLFLVDVNAIRSMAVGAIIVVGVSVLATVTLLPALIALSGARIERWRVRLPFRSKPDGDGRFWVAWTERVMRRPVLALSLSVGFLLLLAAPLLTIETGSGALRQLPADAEVRVATERLSSIAGPGYVGPIQAITNDRETAERLAERAQAIDGVAAVRPPVAARAGNRFLLEVVPASPPETPEARAVLRELRALPIAEGVVFGGATAFSEDIDEAIFGDLWTIVLFVLATSYVVLFLLLRSLLLPLKAVLMNLLSIGAAYGVIVAVFQWGWLDWTGYDSPGYIDTIVPVFVLAITFGLSMDYEVFLLTRIRERYLAGADNTEAVAQGLAQSARTITAAALIMVAVFGSFALAGAISLKEIGVGLAVAILVDATIVRLVLVPATMRLLGDWNWWLPARLARLRGGYVPRTGGLTHDEITR
jgi:uncharacterized membrane protein YdfJ with MMPL/SSD domain